MEFCGGGDLASFIKKHGSLPEAITRKFFRQLAAALQYMRAMNVAHMDLKPQNILLTNRYQPFIKVLVFAISLFIYFFCRVSSILTWKKAHRAKKWRVREMISASHPCDYTNFFMVGVGKVPLCNKFSIRGQNSNRRQHLNEAACGFLQINVGFFFVLFLNEVLGNIWEI